MMNVEMQLQREVGEWGNPVLVRGGDAAIMDKESKE